MRIFDKEVTAIDKGALCGGSCGVCEECQRKASIAVAAYVIHRCGARRRQSNDPASPEQRRYLKNQILSLLAALGITDGEEVRRMVARSEWGRSMRGRQKK